MDQVHIVRSHRGPVGVGTVAVLVALQLTVGLGPVAWFVTLMAVAVAVALLERALARASVVELGPANRVTLTRAVLAGVLAGLVAQSLVAPVSRAALVVVGALALALDTVDGTVARRTGSVSRLGARFDLEVDAFVVLVLSIAVVPSFGVWVLLIGLARYLLWGAQQLWRAARGPVPVRRWRKLVAGFQGVALLAAVGGLIPHPAAAILLVVALVLLAASFGTEVAVRCGRPVTASAAATAVAVAVLWTSLALPADVTGSSPWSLVRIPVEGVVLVAVVLVVPRRVGRTFGLVFGWVVGVLLVLKVVDAGFRAVMDRPFSLVGDWGSLGSAVGVLGDSVGRAQAVAIAVLVGAATLAVLTLASWAGLRTAGLTQRHAPDASRTVVLLGAASVVAAAIGLHALPGDGAAVASSAALAVDEVRDVRADLADRSVFAREIATDPYAGARPGRLAGLRGHDVLLVFVESYGRVAVQDSSFAPGVDAVLDDGTQRLRDAGYGMRSAFLTSPTFGAGSWLAHATVQSGLWVDSEQRYGQLLGARRLTLTAAFGQAGWRTVFDVPANIRDWPEGAAFYSFDALYDARNVGYAGPAFGYGNVPDQYTLARFVALELQPRDRAPVMAEIDLVSSHHPWAPLPHLVPWGQVGDGSIFDGMPEQGQSAAEVFRAPDRVRAAYGRSVEYSLRTLISFLTRTSDRDLVVVMLGDHQPHHYVSGADPGHDVPVTIIARDPRVLDRVAPWRWQPGLRPAPDAPVWRMDAFRDRFLDAFGRSGPSGR